MGRTVEVPFDQYVHNFNAFQVCHCSMHWDDINLEKTSCTPFYAYARSKLVNITFTNELAKRLKGNR